MLNVSFLYCGLLFILHILLALNVVRHRRRTGIALLGLGDEKHLNRAIRIHGNFIENIPLILLGLVLIDSHMTGTFIIHFLGMLTIVGRILHYIGLTKSSGSSPFRMLGMSLTFFVLAMEACTFIYFYMDLNFKLNLF